MTAYEQLMDRADKRGTLIGLEVGELVKHDDSRMDYRPFTHLVGQINGCKLRERIIDGDLNDAAMRLIRRLP